MVLKRGTFYKMSSEKLSEIVKIRGVFFFSMIVRETEKKGCILGPVVQKMFKKGVFLDQLSEK